MMNSVAFKDAPSPSKIEALLKKIKDFDYMQAIGQAKQWIETLGFFVLFLIQDVIGMTAPRTITGFNRDREITGKFHVQEGLEVFGREGLTGPAMMAIPAAAFAVTAATMGRSTFTNSRLIRSFGKSLAETVKGMSAITKKDLHAAYCENGIKQIVQDTLGVGAKQSIIDSTKKDLTNLANLKSIKEEFVTQGKSIADIESILGSRFNLDKVKKLMKNPELTAEAKLDEQQADKLFKKLGKDLQSKVGEDLQKYIDNQLLETKGADLSLLNKVKLGNSSYSAKDVVDALVRYGDDAILNNKNLDKLDEKKAEEFMNSMLGKRCISNLSTMAAVLGIMNYLPKLYAYGDTAPGQVSQSIAESKQQVAKQGDVAFTGLVSKLGKKVGNLSDATLAEGEFRGINFSNTIMSGISILGLTYPRAARAYSRAPEKTPEQRQNEGWFSRMFKKDASEIKEIAIRDPISALSVVFAVPLLTRAMVKSYEDASGFVLINHQADEGKGFKKVLKYLNPYNSIAVLENAELEALYGKVDSHNKLVNVCEFLSRKGGDLEKIFAKSELKENVFNETSNGSFSLKSIQTEAKQVKNEKILNYIKNADEAMQKTMVESLLPTLKKNKALGIAKTLNALPFFLNLLVISPILLGMVIPKYTYKLTRNANAKPTEVPPQQLQQQKPEELLEKRLELKSA